MNLYKQKLCDKDLTESNADRIAKAIEALHYALCQLDDIQFAIYQWQMPNINTMLDDFAKIEELRVLKINTIKKDDSELLKKFYHNKSRR